MPADAIFTAIIITPLLLLPPFISAPLILSPLTYDYFILIRHFIITAIFAITDDLFISDYCLLIHYADTLLISLMPPAAIDMPP
jgi:hypothetical protein